MTPSPTVLVADDDEHVRAVMTATLALHGYAVLEVNDGPEAIRAARGHDGRIDVVVTDVLMPDTDGVTAAAAIVADRPGVRVLFVSAFPDGRPLPLGATFLAKPFSPRQLLEAVAGVLGRC